MATSICRQVCFHLNTVLTMLRSRRRLLCPAGVRVRACVYGLEECVCSVYLCEFLLLSESVRVCVCVCVWSRGRRILQLCECHKLLLVNFLY